MPAPKEATAESRATANLPGTISPQKILSTFKKTVNRNELAEAQ